MNDLPAGNILTHSELIRPFLSQDKEATCRRMLEFIHEVKPAGHASYHLNPNSRPRFSHFTMIRESAYGVDFKDLSYTRDGIPYFFVPAGYLKNPAAWEAKVVEAMATDRQIAGRGVLDILGDVSPEEFTMDVIRLAKDDSGKAYLKVRLHPGMKPVVNEMLAGLFAGKGILSVPTFKIAV